LQTEFSYKNDLNDVPESGAGESELSPDVLKIAKLVPFQHKMSGFSKP
jgi:hypothetical protein